MTHLPTDTEYKLAEAALFLEQLKRNRGKFNKFNFYLSAFISAARSVSWVMRCEYGKIPGWAKWEDAQSKTLTEDEKELLKRSKEMRNHSVKRGPLRAQVVTKIKMPKPQLEALNRFGPGRVSLQGTMQNCRFIIKNQKTGEMAVLPFSKIVKLGRVEPTYLPHRDILTECQDYYDLLVKFVQECAERFARPV